MTRRVVPLVALLILCPSLAADDPKPRYETRKVHDPDGIGKFYLGREIAQVMGHLAAGWLDRPEREREEQPTKLMESLNLKDGDVVADIGAGSGYFTFRIADKVGPKGKVVAVEIQQEMLDIIARKMKQTGVKNIDLVLGKEDDPKLPPESVDLILMVDVYHEFEFPYEMTAAMVKSLKPGGRLVFVEYRLEDPDVPIKLVHKMTERQVLKEMAEHPLKHVKTDPVLPRQHIIVFQKVPPREKPQVVDVWPGRPPGETADVGEERDTTRPNDNRVANRPVIRLGNVSKPTISIHRPAKEIDTGASVVICPGGGYNILAWDLEGEEVAEWLNSIGVTGIVLKYRVPRRPDQPKDQPPVGPLQDAQRALSLVRSRAKEWNLDPNRIGVLGFSAGGHLAAALSTNFDRRAYEAIDEVDKVSCRPDFAVLVYPAYLVNKEKDALLPSIPVTDKTPPMFLTHAGNDGVAAENSVEMYRALKKAKVNAELHVYTTGGHGFGLRETEQPVTLWPKRCEEWLRTQKFLTPGGK